MAKQEKSTKKSVRITKQNIEDLPLPAIIRAFNEELVSSALEEEKIVSWEEDDDGSGPKGGHIVRLDKELHMARLILLEKTKSGEDMKLDSRFLVALVKLLSKSENAVGWYREKMKLWKQFLTIIIEKMKQEPIAVYEKKKPKMMAEKKIAFEEFEKNLGRSP